jgi:hypothetical protein
MNAISEPPLNAISTAPAVSACVSFVPPLNTISSTSKPCFANCPYLIPMSSGT